MLTLALFLHSGAILREITASENVLKPRPLALYIGASGTIDIVNRDLTAEAGVAVTQGTTIPFTPYKITGISGATVYGLYN